jgi:hypothetical protein
VNATGYIINAILVLLVLRQIRESRLDLISLVLPVALVAGAAAYYLRAVPAAGNDIALDLTLAAAGAALGIGCAMATRMRRGGDGVALARAGGVAAVLWVAWDREKPARADARVTAQPRMVIMFVSSAAILCWSTWYTVQSRSAPS